MRVCVSRLGVEEPPAKIVFHQCGFRGCRIGEASNPGPVQTRQARRLERALDGARHPGPTSRRRRRRALPWSWDSDTESDTDPRPSCGGAVGTQVDSSDVPSELLDAMERDCEASHSGPHNADVTAPGRSNDEFANQIAVQDDSGARYHGGVPVFADDFSQPRLKRLRLVSRGAPVQSELTQIVERWSQFPTEGLSWSQGHQTTLRGLFKTGHVPATDSQCWLNLMPRTGSRSTTTLGPHHPPRMRETVKTTTPQVWLGNFRHGRDHEDRHR